MSWPRTGQASLGSGKQVPGKQGSTAAWNQLGGAALGFSQAEVMAAVAQACRGRASEAQAANQEVCVRNIKAAESADDQQGLIALSLWTSAAL